MLHLLKMHHHKSIWVFINYERHKYFYPPRLLIFPLPSPWKSFSQSEKFHLNTMMCSKFTLVAIAIKSNNSKMWKPNLSNDRGLIGKEWRGQVVSGWFSWERSRLRNGGGTQEVRHRAGSDVWWSKPGLQWLAQAQRHLCWKVSEQTDQRDWTDGLNCKIRRGFQNFVFGAVYKKL